MEILVADNNRTVTKIIKMALEDEGYQVKVANSPVEVREIISERVPEIILLDTKFERNKDGYEIAEEILSKHKGAKVIMLVSALEKPDKKLAEELGISAFLTKPVDSRKLFQIISEFEEEIKSEVKTEKHEDGTGIEDIKEEIALGEEKEKEKGRKKTKERGKKTEGKKERKIKEEKKEGEKGKEGVELGDVHGGEVGVGGEEGKEVEEEREHEVSLEGYSVEGEASASYHYGSERTESLLGDVSDEEISDEKKDISFEWVGSKTSEIASEVSVLLEGVKEMFGSIKEIKEEAEGYVREISSVVDSLKKKVEEIPESEKIISQLMEEVVKILEPRLREELKNIEIKLRNEIISDVREETKREVDEKIQLFQEKIISDIKKRVVPDIKDELKKEIMEFVSSELERDIERKINYFISRAESVKTQSDTTHIYSEEDTEVAISAHEKLEELSNISVDIEDANKMEEKSEEHAEGKEKEDVGVEGERKEVELEREREESSEPVEREDVQMGVVEPEEGKKENKLVGSIGEEGYKEGERGEDEKEKEAEEADFLSLDQI